MTFKEFIKHCNTLVACHPEAADYEVIYAIDDEGNGFRDIYYLPTVGRAEDGEFDDKSDEPNAVCVN